MRAGLVLYALIFWGIGVATGLVGVAVTGGWYEYAIPGRTPSAMAIHLDDGWEPIRVGDTLFIRRPRFRLP